MTSAGAFQNGNTTIGEFGGIFRFEQECREWQIRIGNTFLDHVHVKRHSHRAPHVGNTIVVAGVPTFNGFQGHGIEISPIRQFGTVKG